MTWGFWRERCSVFFLFLTLVSAQFKPAMNKSKYWRGVSLSKRSLVTSGFLKTIFRTFWATACLDICSSNGCWDKLTGSLSSSDLVDTSLIRLIKGPLSRSAGKQGQQHHWIRAGKSLWSCQFFPMNKRLGWDHVGSSDNHTRWLLSISCLAVSVCIWQSGGQCPVVLAELDHGDGCTHSGWHSCGSGGSSWGSTQRKGWDPWKGGWEANKQTLHPPAGNPWRFLPWREMRALTHGKGKAWIWWWSPIHGAGSCQAPPGTDPAAPITPGSPDTPSRSSTFPPPGDMTACQRIFRSWRGGISWHRI